MAIAKPGKRRLQDTDEDPPVSSMVNPSLPSIDRLKASLAPRPIRTPATRPGEPFRIPDIPMPSVARPPTLVAGVNEWRQRIPPRNKNRDKTRRGHTGAPDASAFSLGATPHGSMFRHRHLGRPFTPSRHTAISENSPGRLRLPPMLQSPARAGSVRSERSGDTALDETDGLSMEVVVADTPPQNITPASRSGGRGVPELMETAQSRSPGSIPHEQASLFSAALLPLQSPPHGVTSASRLPPRSSAPRRTTRLFNKRLREAHLAGTISTLTEESEKSSRF